MSLNNTNKPPALASVLPVLQKKIGAMLEQDSSAVETHKHLSNMQYAFLTIKMYGWIFEQHIPAVQSVIPEFNPHKNAVKSTTNPKPDTQGSIKVITY